jgi:hypothetical protein
MALELNLDLQHTKTLVPKRPNGSMTRTKNVLLAVMLLNIRPSTRKAMSLGEQQPPYRLVFTGSVKQYHNNFLPCFTRRLHS